MKKSKGKTLLSVTDNFVNHRHSMNIRAVLLFFVILSTSKMFAQGLSYSSEELQVWEENKEEIAKPVEFLAADALAEIQASYQVNPYDIKPIRSFCLRMETHKYLHNYILEDPCERHLNKCRITKLYWDSIAARLIPYNPQIAGSYIGHAVSMASELNISSDSLQKIFEAALFFFRRQRESPCASFVNEEMDSIKMYLSKTQLDRLINALNENEADRLCHQLWEELESACLTDNLDKTSDIGRAYKYYLKELYINTYYMNDASLLEENLTDLYRHKPRIIQMYEGLSKLDAIKKKHEAKVGAEFSW